MLWGSGSWRGCTGERSPGRPGSFWRSVQDLTLQSQKGQLPAGILETWHFLQKNVHWGWWLRLYCKVTALGAVGINSSLHLLSLLYLFLHFPAWQALWNLPSVGISFVSVLSLLLTPLCFLSGFPAVPFPAHWLLQPYSFSRDRDKQTSTSLHQRALMWHHRVEPRPAACSGCRGSLAPQGEEVEPEAI